MSFAVKHAVKKEVSGTFRLLPQSAGRNQNVPVDGVQQQQHHQALPQPASDEEQHSDGDRADRRRVMYSSRTMESVAAAAPTTTATVDRSEDSTFLRHLELEGADGPALPVHPAATPRPPGRTPFTSTRRLQRAPAGGFGFSVAWTQPPRVERVEPGLPAEQAGIRPGDYIIFVDKHNVVTVPEEDVLQLIRSCGNQLTLEVYRRLSPNGMVPQSKSTPAVGSVGKTKPGVPSSASTSSALLSKVATAVAAPTPIGLSGPSAAPGTPASLRQQPPPPPEPRPSTACSSATVGTAASDKRRLHLPQVTFSSEAGGQLTREEARKRAVYQLLSKEQSYSLALQFGVSRFLVPLSERRDLIQPAEHQTLFQNIQEILRITEEVLERLIQEDGEPLVNSVAQVYMAVCPQMTVAYHRYCSGLKVADALLVNKTRNPEFMRTLNDPAVPRRRPDLTAFLHKPLEHYREILKLLQTIHNFTRHSDDDYPLLTKAVHEFQAAYRGLTTSSGIMEPEGEGRPLLTLQDVESRLVFTKCKPFALTAPGRRWIFGGDLVRIEGRSERRYWALLFTDLLLFAQVSRDRVLFISEEPLRLITITQAAFSIKRRATEFRLMVDGSTSPSPTGLGETTKKTKKGDRRRTIVLRAASAEHKAVWQNLIQRQIIYLNTARGGTPAGSPLDSPDPPSLSLTTADSLRDGLVRRPPQVRLDEDDVTLADDELPESLLAPSPPPPTPAPPPAQPPPPAPAAAPAQQPAPTPPPPLTVHIPVPPARPRHKVPGRLYSTFPPRPRPPSPEPVVPEDKKVEHAEPPLPPPAAAAAPKAPSRRSSTASGSVPPVKPTRKSSRDSIRKPSIDGAVKDDRPPRKPSAEDAVRPEAPRKPTKPSTLLPPGRSAARSTRSSSSASSKAESKAGGSTSSKRSGAKSKSKAERSTSTLAFHSPTAHDLPSCPPSLPPSTAPSPAPTPGSKTGSLFPAPKKPARKTTGSKATGSNALPAPSTSSYRRRCS